MSSPKKKSICIIGLGFVGLTLAVILAKKGFRVYGVEKKKNILDNLKNKKSHFYEPNLNNELKFALKKKFTFSKKIPSYKDISTYIITVGTPLNNNKKIITSYIKQTSREIKKVLKKDDLIILRSTVKVGTTRKIVYPILNEKGVKYHLTYCPERAVEGSALKELKHLPQIIGGIDRLSVNKASQIFRIVTKKIIPTSDVETAEMIKLIDNSSRDVFFAYANEIARVCDNIGINSLEVIRSGKLNYDRTDIAQPGLVGGPCLHKDPYILSDSVNKDISAEITLTARKINERQPYEIVSFILKKINDFKLQNKNLKISLLGFAFKGIPTTDDMRGSMSLKVLKILKNKIKKSKIYGYDPIIPINELKKLKIIPVKSLCSAFNNKDIVIILNNHLMFQKMKIKNLSKKLNKPSLIYDVWGLFENKKIKNYKNSQYVSLGAHSKSI